MKAIAKRFAITNICVVMALMILLGWAFSFMDLLGSYVWLTADAIVLQVTL